VEDKNPRSSAWKEGVVQQVSNTLYQNRIHLRAAFRLFDSANCGVISANAFQEGMLAVNKLLENPLSPVQIDELRKALDRNGDGRIDYREFFEGLAIQDTNRIGGAAK
jgi:protein phosphatase